MIQDIYGRDFERPEDKAYKEAHEKAKEEKVKKLFGLLGDYHVLSLGSVLSSYDLDINSALAETHKYPEYNNNKKSYQNLLVELVEGTTGKVNAFSRNFRPLAKPESESGERWKNLYRSMRKGNMPGGLIKTYEFLHYYYIDDGNHRRSVSKSLGREIIPGEVTRIIPPKDSHHEEFDRYHEFLEFEKKTGISSIWFSEEGKFDELEKIVDYLLPNYTDKFDCLVNKLYYPFLQTYKKTRDKEFYYQKGDLFLDFLEDIYDPEELTRREMRRLVKHEIRKRKKKIHDEKRLQKKNKQLEKVIKPEQGLETNPENINLTTEEPEEDTENYA